MIPKLLDYVAWHCKEFVSQSHTFFLSISQEFLKTIYLTCLLMHHTNFRLCWYCAGLFSMQCYILFSHGEMSQ